MLVLKCLSSIAEYKELEKGLLLKVRHRISKREEML